MWIIGNKELLKLFFALIVVLICMVIVFKTHKLFRLSSYTGIRYFRNAFFFYGIGFAIRFFIGSPIFDNKYLSAYYPAINSLFEFFLVMAGFFLLYSLLWKNFEHRKHSLSSLFNFKIFIFYLVAFIIVVLDSIWKTNYFMFASQILLFVLASGISYLNYIKKKNREFLKFYFIAMILSLIAWVLNALAALYFNWNQAVLINIYILNLIVFLLFLYGVIKVTRI